MIRASENARHPRGASIGALLAEGRSALAASPLSLPPREALLLLAHVLGLDEARLRARDRETVPPEAACRYRSLLDRRAAGEPAAYLLGRREFYGREFVVDRRVLVPRPETEHLIETVLALDLPPRARLLDVGTGSGCIAITLALELPDSTAVATDLSPGALAVASLNARRLGVEGRTRFLGADLTRPLELGGFDLLASNPPYVACEAANEMSPEVVEHEPHLALFAPGHGRSMLGALLDRAAGLRPGTPVVLELGFDQGEWIRTAPERRSHLRFERLVHDYAGHPRTAVLRRL
ncbi:MAG: peptide chain release factor N(5)-glutamine methyltransferase [Holophagales bacterium]|nr:peptide chain release factor N(5)-glutamine methyltransferase [Holophagales bacterium]